MVRHLFRFLTCGDPDLETTESWYVMAEAGADLDRTRTRFLTQQQKDLLSRKQM